ncbi:MAG: hypothetical protein HY296_04980 [Thaumarchaeota archaeon]|nr:hypothetical protein [Nitrososphaerota archaeon]
MTVRPSAVAVPVGFLLFAAIFSALITPVGATGGGSDLQAYFNCDTYALQPTEDGLVFSNPTQYHCPEPAITTFGGFNPEGTFGGTGQTINQGATLTFDIYAYGPAEFYCHVEAWDTTTNTELGVANCSGTPLGSGDCSNAVKVEVQAAVANTTTVFTGDVLRYEINVTLGGGQATLCSGGSTPTGFSVPSSSTTSTRSTSSTSTSSNSTSSTSTTGSFSTPSQGTTQQTSQTTGTTAHTSPTTSAQSAATTATGIGVDLWVWILILVVIIIIVLLILWKMHIGPFAESTPSRTPTT